MDSTLLKLNSLVTSFCKEELVWSELTQGEKEPEYTRRVLFPQLQTFVKGLNDSRVTANSDGFSRPFSAQFANQSFYPDLSLNFNAKRTIAFETKFLWPEGFSSSFLKAVGQGVIYSSFGYPFSHLILVSGNGAQILDVRELDLLNSRLERINVLTHHLSRR